jgi:three-Cys-motif partner protein
MSSNKDFFLTPQAAAVYKHKLIKSYIPAWVGKVGSTSANNHLVVYDAYSGPGRYEDDQPGSPELLVDTAVSMASLRSVYSVFSEKEQSYCDRLRSMLADKQVDPSTYQIRQGPVEDHLNSVLEQTGDIPLFVFLDPFGLTIDFAEVVRLLHSRDKAGLGINFQPKTELLMNFSYEAVRRIAGVVRSEKDYPARPAQIKALDDALGGDWWQELAATEPPDWVHQVLVGFARRVAERAGGYGYITANVADSLEAKPVYDLVLFTRHPDGLWEMARSMSMARKEWRQWLVERRQEATGGQAEIRGLSFDDNEDAWIDEISANVQNILIPSRTSSLKAGSVTFLVARLALPAKPISGRQSRNWHTRG